MSRSLFNTQDAIRDLITIRDFIRWGVTHFNQANLCYGHGTDNSWDEAVHLVLSAVHLSPDSDTNVLDARLTQDEKKRVTMLIERRITERIPVPYLLKEAWFSGLSFYVDERVIIPRSPIAELINEEFRPWVAQDKVTRILDLCTGSGCIAITAALTFLDATVDAVDFDKAALEVAAHNVKQYDLEERVSLIYSDLFDNLGDQKYNIIISNPPYVGEQAYKNLPQEYSHEPKIALEAGLDGLTIVKRILSQAHRYLTSKGILIVEVGLTQSAVEAAFPNIPFTWLQFEHGGEGVFLLTFDELVEFSHYFQ